MFEVGNLPFAGLSWGFPAVSRGPGPPEFLLRRGTRITQDAQVSTTGENASGPRGRGFMARTGVAP